MRFHRALTSAVAGVVAAVTAAAPASASSGRHTDKPRTVVTTDMESDDIASLVRYLLYTNELDTQGIIYSSSKFHWAGDGKGTEFFLPGREYKTPQTSWRWTGSTTIETQIIPAYAKVYPNLRKHDAAYPSPAKIRSLVRLGNIAFEGEMASDTPGSNLIRDLLLDRDRRPLYLQAWGGTSTIARALKSIEERYSGTPQWSSVRAAVSKKAVILASGFQDETYANYISKAWPALRVEELSAGYATWGFNCNNDGQGNVRGLPADRAYFTGDWIRRNIQIGPWGSLYRSWLDGQTTPGDPLDVFGDPVKAPGGWCKPMSPYDFLSEGDNVVFNQLLRTGLQNPAAPAIGGWGGRAYQVSASPDLWRLVPTEKDATGADVADLTTLRWAGAAQNDFAARIQWTLTPRWSRANHPPSVRIAAGDTVPARPGATVSLGAKLSDPDGRKVTASWWQYREEGTYPGAVAVTGRGSSASVKIPADARPGQTISVILQGTDSGTFPLTRYDRVVIRVV
ncbi:hypothetical protein Aab01nite_77740 [Paractinoplanes abujensis]|uniref:DUF1593 domain-containing protein n=1 Tax=Paractinoplanes abujensis TaxID=882441 RepID=A0A7W7CPK6_9ACTN|nr:DUF1593 domain-containing protein [Actinoplanes abujensis]MBB4692338.1 hypothetical protein [Actinoplanes abujensis]GID24184.1 hypothetical protein Aab01nite_77740 [Actinoplanes abujensis]